MVDIKKLTNLCALCDRIEEYVEVVLRSNNVQLSVVPAKSVP